MGMVRHIQITSPSDIKALLVRCGKCGTEVRLTLAHARPAYECPGCKALIDLKDALEAARAIRCLQTGGASDCTVEFETEDRVRDAEG